MTTETFLLLLNKLPTAAKEAHRAPGIAHNLVSAATLANTECELFFHKTGCKVSLNGEIILQGWRDPDTRLWRISILPTSGNNIIPTDHNLINLFSRHPAPQVSSIYECKNTNQLINFYYATMGYPVISMWIKAIDKGYFRGWRGLTSDLTSDRVRCFVKTSQPSEQGHMNQRRAGIQSIKSSSTNHLLDTMDEPMQAPENNTTNMVHNYNVIFYVVDANYIKSYPVKSHHCTELLKAYIDVYQFLRIQGYHAQLHKLDNESSEDVEEFIVENNTELQYTPPDIHRTNPAERAICTCKNCVVAIRAGAPKTYRLSNWCKDLEQTDITLNMMRPNTQNPNLSAHELMEGMFSFDATPITPIGTECMIHIKPNQRHTWGYHSMKAWYVAPAINHYHCVKVVTDTGAVRITDTFKFLDRTLPIPTISPTNRIVQSTKQLKHAIERHNTAAPNELDATADLHALLSGAQPDPPLPESPPPPLAEDPREDIEPPAAAPPLQLPAHAVDKNISPTHQHALTAIPFNQSLVKISSHRLAGTTFVPKLATSSNLPLPMLSSGLIRKNKNAHSSRLSNLIDYPWEVATPTSDPTTVKLLFNSVISTPGAVFVVMDVNNFYLNTPMERPEYMRLQLKLIPDEIIAKDNLRNKVDANGWVYMRIGLGMYSLLQAGRLANKLLQKQLNLEGYYHCQFTPGLWRHKWRPITFSLFVDNFGIETVGLSHVKHLKHALEKYNEVTVDWKGYIPKALTCFHHPPPKKAQHAPYKAAPIQHGNKLQLTQEKDNSPKLSRDKIKYIQQLVGTLLYSSQAVGPTLAAALSTIASQQSHGTEAVLDACTQLLDYVALHLNTTICCCASDMILALDTNGSYLSEQGGKSRAAAYFYLTKKNNPDFHNDSVLILSTIIKHIMASASETELAALFYGANEAIALCTALKEMGHPQSGPTPVTTDNSTAVGLTMDTMIPRASKAMDMRFQWLKCRRAQSLFRYLWAKGIKNRADYPSKHHSAAHHQ
eukprot:CCRYP_021093-RA/>CCRYP_021093-RA protein AED:0.19 eAED:0.14 QI:0/0/0/1/1/1/4/0/1001